ncbi:MAG: dioxygenase [Deltaproteobacteria bacterium]|nr:dioxygenase [Myxococcales bacterium]MDP3215301.1 dioxygenase [Deltaproteobacteria bacterium]
MTDDRSHHRGLAHDLRVMEAALTRRRILGCFAGAALMPVIGCGTDASTPGADAATGTDAGTDAGTDVSTDAGTDAGTCTAIPAETAGPFPGDGTNGANALALAGVVRRDIRASVGPAAGVAPGVLLTVRLTLLDASGACAPLAGHAIYLWHCDRDGHYSMYSPAVAGENFLRGVQETDGAGSATFTTIFPGAYPGRWPHMHFEVFRSLATAMSGGNALITSQLALPEAACAAAYAADGYSASARELPRMTLATDGVFRDGAMLQLATVTGDGVTGFVASLVAVVLTG